MCNSIPYSIIFFGKLQYTIVRGDMMESHSKTYEQFCWVKGKNIVMEETVFHNGLRRVICTSICDCENKGGCKNKSLKKLWGGEKAEDTLQCE